MNITLFSGRYAFLSNFWRENNATVEHQFQAAKTLDSVWVKKILDASTPGKAKRLGRQCPLRSDWEEIKDSVMLECLESKFSPESRLSTMLLATGNSILIEGNRWHDNYWGSCVCLKCGNKGKNTLGKLLMQVREGLRVPSK